MFTLYSTPRSANGRKPLAVCSYLGLAPEIQTVDVYLGQGRAPAYLAVHPLGKVPALVDGDLVLWESNAISEYIAEAYGDGRLWSRDPRKRADISRWMYWEASQWQPALAGILRDFVAWKLGLSDAAAPVDVNWMDPSFQRQAMFLDTHLRSRRYLTGDEITLADFSAAAMVMYVASPGDAFAGLPGILGWYERIEELDAWKQTAADPWR